MYRYIKLLFESNAPFTVDIETSGGFSVCNVALKFPHTLDHGYLVTFDNDLNADTMVALDHIVAVTVHWR